MLTVGQLKMARSALGWSIQLLAEKSLVSVRTIKRIESEGMIDKVTPANMKLLRDTLEAAGIEFIGEPGEGPGVRLWTETPRGGVFMHAPFARSSCCARALVEASKPRRANIRIRETLSTKVEHQRRWCGRRICTPVQSDVKYRCLRR